MGKALRTPGQPRRTEWRWTVLIGESHNALLPIAFGTAFGASDPEFSVLAAASLIAWSCGDGDTLTYTAQSATNVATVTVSGSSALVTVVASDPSGLTARQSFVVLARSVRLSP